MEWPKVTQETTLIQSRSGSQLYTHRMHPRGPWGAPGSPQHSREPPEFRTQVTRPTLSSSGDSASQLSSVLK